jgi:hypothetical protein
VNGSDERQQAIVGEQAGGGCAQGCELLLVSRSNLLGRFPAAMR